MALLKVVGDRLLLRLNPVEKLMDLRVRSPSVPLTAIRRVSVVEHPGGFIEGNIRFGFAGDTAPLGAVVTAFSRGKVDGGRAAVFVYLRRSSVRLDLDDKAARWRLFLVSCRNAEKVAAELGTHLAAR
jgi:hypothetical protein